MKPLRQWVHILQQATTAHQQGDLSTARQGYEKVLSLNPQQPDALHLLGVIALQNQDYQQAQSLIEAALAKKPQSSFYANLGRVYQAQGQLEKALNAYEAALKREDQLPLHFQVALLLQETGRFAAAEARYRQLLPRMPGNPHLYNNLGNCCLEQEKWQEAADFYQQALDADPNFALSWYNQGRFMQLRGQPQTAIDCFTKALALDPQIPDFYNSLAMVYQQQGDYLRAIELYRQALALAPDASIYSNLGACQHEQGDYAAALASYQMGLTLEPHLANLLFNQARSLKEMGQAEAASQVLERSFQLTGKTSSRLLKALLLPPIYQDQADLASWQARYREQLDQLVDDSRLQLSDPLQELNTTNFFLPYQGALDRPLQEQLVKIYRQACPRLNFVAPHCENPRKDADRIRIGFISRHFRNHTISKLFRGWVAELDRKQFEVFVFFTEPPRPGLGQWIADQADHVQVLPLHLWQAQDQIAAQKPDILFYPDLGMEPFTYFLSLLRLAPLQCLTWGHPITSGSRSLDLFFSSQGLETAGAEAFYTEKLIRMQRLIAYFYFPHIPQQLKSKADYGLPEKASLYFCPQTLFKFHLDFDFILKGILEADPDSRILLLEDPHPEWNQLLRQRFAKSLGDVQTRIEWLPRQSTEDFFNLMALSDLILDPLHFGGGNSSYEAFAVGTPIVSQPSDYLKGRITAAQYQLMGMDSCLVNSADAYIAKALEIAQNKDLQRSLRDEIAARRAPLYEDKLAIREMETILRQEFQALS